MNDSIAPSRVLGIFGMSIFTRRGDLEKLFEEYGPIEKVEIIHNRQVSTGSTAQSVSHPLYLDWKIKGIRVRLL